MSRNDFRHWSKVWQKILLLNDTLPILFVQVQVFFWNSSRAHLLPYKISRSWIDRVGLGSGFSSHRLLDSGQGLWEKTCEGCHRYYKLFLTICKKKLVMMNCMKQRRRAVIWKPPCLGQTWSIDISKGRPPKTLFWGKRGGGQIPKFS